MKKLIVTAALSALATTAVHAQDTTAAPTVAPVVAELAPAAPVAAIVTSNAVLRAGTPVSFSMMEEITTKKKAAKVGQRFMLEVSAPVEVNGVTVVPAGTPAWGEIVGVRNKGMWGKSGKLDAKLLFLRVNGRQIRLTGSFDDKGVTGTAGVVGAIALVPIAGFFMTGTSAMLPKGGVVSGFIDEDIELAIANTKPAPLAVSAPAAPLAVSEAVVVESEADVEDESVEAEAAD
ncbi:hypothetical protein [uncultured Parasphingorhabdus sp.]|uniref:hypothetical protein n=1 Tax=uncultured Parasphingorhabdus sp. TaxID=2709694 RepID=UPI0030D753EF